LIHPMPSLGFKRGLSCIYEEPIGPLTKVRRASSPDTHSAITPNTLKADQGDMTSVILATPSDQNTPSVSQDQHFGRDHLILQDTSTVRETAPNTPAIPSIDLVDEDLTAFPPVEPIRQLYYYQSDILALLIKALNSPTAVKRLAVSSPAGSGKTNAFVALLPDIPNRGNGDKVLIVVPSLEIMRQVKKCISTLHPRRYQVEVEHGGNHPRDDDADMYVPLFNGVDALESSPPLKVCGMTVR
jgi:hypothetical protein